MNEPVLHAEAIRVGYQQAPVLDNLSLDLFPGKVTALIGPNGSGKSTLLKALGRLLKPRQGVVYLDGKAIAQYTTSEVARRMAVLPQAPTAPEGITVRELVEQGRFPHAGALRMLRQQDHEATQEALELTHMQHLADRSLDALSGGERQRAWIALTLAQQTGILLLDEPTTFLDIGHQLEVLELLERLHRTAGLTIVMVLHDLNQAARYADRLLVLREGRIIGDGAPQDILTERLLADVFRIRARLLPDANGKLLCVPVSSLLT
ncbi:MAG: ABC transporter ATP-binding protein [Anaerolineales bacterium]